MNERKEVRETEIDNLHLAAYLKTVGVPLIHIAKSGRVGIFYFPEESATPQISLYMTNRALVEPKAYAGSIRELKRMVDEATRSGGGVNE